MIRHSMIKWFVGKGRIIEASNLEASTHFCQPTFMNLWIYKPCGRGEFEKNLAHRLSANFLGFFGRRTLNFSGLNGGVRRCFLR